MSKQTRTIRGREADPINKQARRVTSPTPHGAGPTTPNLREDVVHTSAPPHMERPPKAAPDLVGMRRGQLTVIGYHGSKKSRGSQWVCRCDCGRYEIRLGSSIQKGIRDDLWDACYFCQKTAFLRDGH